MSIYDYSVPSRNGEISMSEYKGKVLLIVNTATGCGFTPQYEDIEKIYEEFLAKYDVTKSAERPLSVEDEDVQ